jgi:hypothetical protein
MKRRIFTYCGVIAPLVFVFMAILGAGMRPGYSHMADTVSELLSPGSPNRLLLILLLTMYSILTALFGVGILLFVRGSEESKRLGSIGAVMFILAGIIDVSIATVFPQDPWGSAPTLAGQMHLQLGGVIGALQIISVFILGIWFYQTQVSRRLGAYSIITAVVVVAALAYFLTMVGTPLMGFAERVLILIDLVWTFVIALWMTSRIDSLAREIR